MSKKLIYFLKNLYTVLFPIIIFVFSYMYRIALNAFQHMESNFHIFLGIAYALCFLLFLSIIVLSNKSISIVSVITGILLAIILLIPYIMPFSVVNSFYTTPLLIFNMLFVCIAIYIFFFMIRKSNSDF